MKKKLNCILLVDDDEPTNYYNKKVVQMADCCENVEVCLGVDEALAFLKDGEEKNYPKPEIIFLDINMPGKDGWDFLQEHQGLDYDAKGDVVVVMLTTSLNPADEEKAFENGAKEFARKPLTVDQIHNIIQEYLPDYW